MWRRSQLPLTALVGGSARAQTRPLPRPVASLPAHERPLPPASLQDRGQAAQPVGRQGLQCAALAGRRRLDHALQAMGEHPGWCAALARLPAAAAVAWCRPLCGAAQRPAALPCPTRPPPEPRVTRLGWRAQQGLRARRACACRACSSSKPPGRRAYRPAGVVRDNCMNNTESVGEQLRIHGMNQEVRQEGRAAAARRCPGSKRHRGGQSAAAAAPHGGAVGRWEVAAGAASARTTPLAQATGTCPAGRARCRQHGLPTWSTCHPPRPTTPTPRPPPCRSLCFWQPRCCRLTSKCWRLP